MHEVAAEAQPGSPIAVLSGPTFAHEVAAGLPTAVTLAVEDQALGEALVARIARPFFRPYLSDDVAGAEVGGAVKNVLAIACGVVEGLRARPECPRRADLARLRRDDPLRPRQGRAGRRRWRGSPGSAISSSPAPRPARAISASARGSARARARPSCSPTARPWPKAPSPRRCCSAPRPRSASTCRSSTRSARLLAEQASVDEVVERLLSRPLRPRASRSPGRSRCFPSRRSGSAPCPFGPPLSSLSFASSGSGTGGLLER